MLSPLNGLLLPLAMLFATCYAVATPLLAIAGAITTS